MVAVLGVLLGVAASLFLESRKSKREQHLQLSHDLSIEEGVTDFPERVRDNVEIRYAGVPVPPGRVLASVKCEVENTGNRVVKGQTIRFIFDSDVQVLDRRFDPLPDAELGAEVLSAGENGVLENTFSVGHIEVGQRVTLHLVINASGRSMPRIVAHNESGDVRFVARDVARVADDSQGFVQFIRGGVLFVLVSLFATSSFFGDLLSIFVGIIQLGLAVWMVQHLGASSRVLRTVISERLSVKGRPGSINVTSSKSTIAIATNGHLRMENVDTKDGSDES